MNANIGQVDEHSLSNTVHGEGLEKNHELAWALGFFPKFNLRDARTGNKGEYSSKYGKTVSEQDFSKIHCYLNEWWYETLSIRIWIFQCNSSMGEDEETVLTYDKKEVNA